VIVKPSEAQQRWTDERPGPGHTRKMVLRVLDANISFAQSF